jgi:hypothetical protein
LPARSWLTTMTIVGSTSSRHHRWIPRGRMTRISTFRLVFNSMYVSLYSELWYLIYVNMKFIFASIFSTLFDLYLMLFEYKKLFLALYFSTPGKI